MPRQIIRVKRDEFFRVFNRGIILILLKIRDGEILQANLRVLDVSALRFEEA